MLIVTNCRSLFHQLSAAASVASSFYLRRKDMTDKELRKLRRSELIEILYYMRREIDELSEQNRKLESRIDRLIGKAAPVKDEPDDETAAAENGEVEADGE